MKTERGVARIVLPLVYVQEKVMHRALDRIRAEFLEMPGLRLTIEQAHRLCGVEQSACAEVLDELVREEFLVMKADGRYARLTDGAPRARPAKVQPQPHARRRSA